MKQLLLLYLFIYKASSFALSPQRRVSNIWWKSEPKNYIQETMLHESNAALVLRCIYMPSDLRKIRDAESKGAFIQLHAEEEHTVDFANILNCSEALNSTDCNKRTTLHGLKCNWFYFNSHIVGAPNGTCVLSYGTRKIDYLGNPSYPDKEEVLLDLKAKGYSVATIAKNIACMKRSVVNADCNDECSLCEMPDVYGFRWKNMKIQDEKFKICGLKSFWNTNANSKGWCDMLNDIPIGATNILTGKIYPSQQKQTNHKRSITSTSTTTTSFRTINTSTKITNVGIMEKQEPEYYMADALTGGEASGKDSNNLIQRPHHGSAAILSALNIELSSDAAFKSVLSIILMVYSLAV